MRYFGLTVAGALLAGTPASAQQAPAAGGPPPAASRLDVLLAQWERAMTGIQSIEAQCTRTSIDKTFNVVEVYEGVARYMKPNLAMLHMVKKGKPEIFEKYVCTGTFLYEYAPAEKVIRVHELPPPKPGQVADDNFLSFLFGMKAEEAKRRYDLKLVKGPPEDQWYYYVEILPRFPADKADFSKARLVLNAQTFLPRELWFEQPNKNEVKWDIPRITPGAVVNRTDFTSPAPPPGWKLERVPKNNAPPPRAIRSAP